jgi:myo-inositol-1(or 4)-monophosphatase
VRLTAFKASGYVDGLWASGEIKIWDIAAGYVIAKEAGIVITDIKGDNNIENASVIIAANKKIQPKITKLLAKHLK